MKNEKLRLDMLLLERKMFESRERARSSIMSGNVYVNNIKATKAGELFKIDSNIEVKGDKLIYVSRGGLKLEKAIKEFNISLKDKICMDIGASTGGFTDCMLQNFAKKVYAVDVGYGQLAWKLRIDERVINLERENIRYLDNEKIKEKINFISVDVAFISLKKIVDKIDEIIDTEGEVLALIKPQFEAGRENIGKKGVVRDINVHKDVVTNIYTMFKDRKFYIKNFSFSPIKGPEGNIEFLIYITKKESENLELIKVLEEVENAHKILI